MALPAASARARGCGCHHHRTRDSPALRSRCRCSRSPTPSSDSTGTWSQWPAITLAASIAFSSYFKGFVATIPILLGIIVGYLSAIPFGLVDFQPVLDAAWIGLPDANDSEVRVLGDHAHRAGSARRHHRAHRTPARHQRDHRQRLQSYAPAVTRGRRSGDVALALVGGTPSTTYAENIGVMAVTRIYAVQLFWYAGAFAFVIGGFVPKLGALIGSIPTPVMGGVSVLLFGLIAASGLRMLVDSGIDYSHSRNLILSSIVLVLGIGMEVGEIQAFPR
jgi:xanthine/uracil permease